MPVVFSITCLLWTLSNIQSKSSKCMYM
jgi:hypothetical protein